MQRHIELIGTLFICTSLLMSCGFKKQAGDQFTRKENDGNDISNNESEEVEETNSTNENKDEDENLKEEIDIIEKQRSTFSRPLSYQSVVF